MHCFNRILPALLLALPFASSAETLDDAWSAALESHHLIAAATAERDAAGLDVAQARAVRLPQVGVSTSYTQLDGAPRFAFGDGLTSAPIFAGDDFVRAGAQISLPLYTGGAVRSGIEAARSGADAAGKQLETVIQDIKLGVAEHYVGVLRAESAVSVAESIVASLSSHTTDTKNRFDFGAVPQNDYLAASVTLANAKQRLLQAENALEYARFAYNRYLGRQLDAPVSLDPALDIDKLLPGTRGADDLVALARVERPELTALERQASALRRQSDLARSQSRPRFALTGNYLFLENEFLDDDAFWMAGLSLQWNLFDGGQSRRRAAALDQRALAVSHNRADLDTMIALQVRGAWNDRSEAENRLDVAESAVVQAGENLRVVRNRYAAGASRNVEVLDAEALREQSLSNRDNARFEVVLAKLRLARAAGGL